MLKICTQCSVEKPIHDFGIRNLEKRMYHEWCKICLNKYAKNYRAKNKIVVRERQQIWYKSKGHEWKKKYDKKNLARVRIRDRKRYHSDAEYRTKKILRTRLIKVLKGNKMYTKILNYIGTDWIFLRKWFEYLFQFDKKISWENQGIY